MDAVIEILPSALGAAISPIPIIAVILMLLTAQANVNGIAFTFGWVLTLLAVSTIAFVVTDSHGDSSKDEVERWVSGLKVVLAILLLYLAYKQWTKRPQAGVPASGPPKWMRKIDQFSPLKAFGTAALLAGPNPKNLLLAITAGSGLAQMNASGSSAALGLIAFALIGTVTVGGPVVYYFFAADHATRLLTKLKDWLAANSAMVMTVLFSVIGIVMLVEGLRGLR